MFVSAIIELLEFIKALAQVCGKLRWVVVPQGRVPQMKAVFIIV
jgi:hypothetical protein